MRTLNPDWNFTDQELQLYESYIEAYLDEYSDLSPTDRIQLRDASAFHIMHIRFLNAQHTSWNTRYLPKSIELNVLESLGATRKQRVDTRKPSQGKYTDEELAILAMAFENKDKVRRT